MLSHPRPSGHLYRIYKTGIGSVTKKRRGRRPLLIPLEKILCSIRHNGKVLTAAQELGCSDAYIHVRLRAAGLSLGEVLYAPCLAALLNKKDQKV